MRLLLVGTLDGPIAGAGRIALSKGAKVAHVGNVEQALYALRNGQGADLMFFDLNLEIEHMLKSLKTERIHLPVIACGIGIGADRAAASIRAGAKEYLPLPPDADLIAAILQAVAEENNNVICNDPAMAEIVKLARQMAPSDASILITGESGTGKEVMAHFIHIHSKRAAKQFVSINCAAIPENLLESELFGHEKGAFTGAVARRIGKFEEANGGTLLLDEISEMHPRLQAKLLRAVQEREIDRVGGTQPVRVDIRLIATSNRNLVEEVTKGNFREDLYFRLNVLSLELPSLRNRPKDIPALAHYFLKKYAKLNNYPALELNDEALAALTTHKWRGNVRELENNIHRAVLLSGGQPIGRDAFKFQEKPSDMEKGKDSPLVGQSVAQVERNLIIDTLAHCLGNRTHAANILGISIRTLRNKLKQYGDEGWVVPESNEAEPLSL